jgi:hypothetical protein
MLTIVAAQLPKVLRNCSRANQSDHSVLPNLFLGMRAQVSLSARVAWHRVVLRSESMVSSAS